MEQLLKTAYGSHLYGTNTPTSDYDYKVVYLPAFENVLLGRKLPIFKERWDAEGNRVGDGQPMPDGGVETEYVPFQVFTQDYLNGQTYALEVAQALYEKGPAWLRELVQNFTTCNVSSMAGFAMKQTFDYVHRGVRLEKARLIKDTLVAMDDELLEAERDPKKTYRLDSDFRGRKFLHVLAERAGAELGETINNGRVMQTLKLNGRDYLETTTTQHMLGAVEKLIASYGHRTAAAAEQEVDLKSLMHAVRVYEQCAELLTVGRISFPRAEREYLLNVKKGNVELEEVKARLLELEELVGQLQKFSRLLPEKTPALQASFDEWLLGKLRELYDLR